MELLKYTGIAGPIIMLLSNLFLALKTPKFNLGKQPVSLFGTWSKTKSVFTFSYAFFVVCEVIFTLTIFTKLDLWRNPLLTTLVSASVIAGIIPCLIPAKGRLLPIHYGSAIMGFGLSCLTQLFISVAVAARETRPGLLAIGFSLANLLVILNFFRKKYDTLTRKYMFGLTGTQELTYILGLLLWSGTLIAILK